MVKKKATSPRRIFESQPSDIVTLTRCSRCRAGIAIGWCDAFSWRLDVVDLDPAREAAALMSGRATFGVYGRPGRAWLRSRLPKLVHAGLPRLGASAVLAEHRCPTKGLTT